MRHVDRSEPSSPAARRFAAAALVIGISFAGLAGCKSTDETATARPATPTVSNQPPGQQVYVRSCARCHGVDFRGKGGHPGIDQAKLNSLGDQRLRITISTGKGKMPGFGSLSTAQVDALIAYLKAAS